MTTLKALRKKAAARPKGRKTKVLSTSEARANFAEALETAQVDNAVIGFDRYGRTVAALVPVEAIYMLAGVGHVVDAKTREEIVAGARQFAQNVPYRMAGEQEPAIIAAPAKAAKPKSKKGPPLTPRSKRS